MVERSAHAVQLFGELTDAPVAALRRAAQQVLAAEQAHARIDISLLGLRSMRQLNAQYLGHDYPTDVISFALPLPDGSIAGDVFICRYVAARQARERGVPVREELVRLVVHGILHVLGHDHPVDASRERSAMWQKQEAYVARVA